jgi:glycerol transport system permease protein
MLPIYWLVNDELQDDQRDPPGSPVSADFTLENYIAIFTDPTWYWATSTRSST